MKDERIKDALESIAQDIPQDTNLWPVISARAANGRNIAAMNPRTKLAWTVLLVLLGLAVFSTVGYALYRYFFDPGLRNVSQAGMLTDLDATAQPTQVIGTPMWGMPKPATQVNEIQTQDGVSLALNWIYVEDGHQAIGFTVSGLGEGERLGLPTVSYAGVKPEAFSGATMRLDEQGNGMLVMYQIVRDGVKDSKVDVGLDIPVKRAGEAVSTFHFDLKDVPTDMTGGGGGNSYAVRVNGVELRQEYIIVAPDYSEAKICYPAQPGGDWQLQDVSLKFMDQTGQAQQEAVAMEGAKIVSEAQGERCAVVTFPLGNTEGLTALITVGALSNGTERIEGGWQFNTVLENLVLAEGAALSTPTAQAPLAEETIGDLKAVLDWAYADANRMAFEMHFDGWKEGYFMNGVSLRTADGTEVNSGLGYQPSQDDPSRFTLDFEPVDEPGAGRFNGELVLMVSNDPVNYASFAEYHFKLDLPIYPAMVLDPAKKVSANGTQMLLQRVKITPSYTYAYLCFNKPTTGDYSDWQFAYGNEGMSPSLRIGADQAAMNSGMMIFDSDLGDLGKPPDPGWVTPIQTGRCLRLGFPVGQHDKPETLTLTIPALEKSMPEVVPDAEVKKAQEILRAEGIEMTYTTFRGNGGGGGGPVFTRKPDGMTDQEAYRKFVEALGYVHEGPWVFTLEINP